MLLTRVSIAIQCRTRETSSLRNLTRISTMRIRSNITNFSTVVLDRTLIWPSPTSIGRIAWHTIPKGKGKSLFNFPGHSSKKAHILCRRRSVAAVSQISTPTQRAKWCMVAATRYPLSSSRTLEVTYNPSRKFSKKFKRKGRT